MANNTFDFPLDLYPKAYAGPTPEFQGMLTSLIPQAQQTFQDFPGQMKQFQGRAREDIEKGYGGAIADVGKTYERTLQPALQQTMNKLTRRGMLSSKVGGEALAGTARGIGRDVIGQQSQLQLAKQLALAQLMSQEGQGMYQYPQLLTNLLSQGRISESSDEGVPYRSALGFLQSLMV